jgi:hypothetical protein
MAKISKGAVELANVIRSQLSEPKMRVAVFADTNGGWRATVYADNGAVRDLQKRVDATARELNGIYVLA